jgi:Tfp pilus assembly protein PilV
MVREESGYSLVEVLAAIMLLSLAILPMVGMFDAGLRAASLGGNYDRARAIAGGELEEIRALPFSRPGGAADSVVEIYPPGNPWGTRTCTAPVDAGFGCQVRTRYIRLDGSTGAMVADPSALAMVQAEVTVTWSGGKSFTTTGLVSEVVR